jgi:thiamine-phosphate pyrophosphorylase
VNAVHLVWALVLDESRASEILAGIGLSRGELERLLGAVPEALDSEAREIAGDCPHSPELASVVIEAARQAAQLGKHVEIGSEHLLWGLTAVESPVQELLAARGLVPDQVARHAEGQTGESAAPLSVDIRLAAPAGPAREEIDALRAVDASANRFREALRSLEDYTRFVLADAHLTARIKACRHRFAAACETVSPEKLSRARDTLRDVGTQIHTPREVVRQTTFDVAQSAFKRAQEAARSLEEFGKMVAPELAREALSLRYEIYTIEKGVLATRAAQERLRDCRLYVLVSSKNCPGGAGPVVRGALGGGAHLIQVREKRMGDRELVSYGRLVREWTARAGALYVMNDRPDLAVLTGADGVHVGQDELTVHDARRIVGPDRLIGVSTHSIEQARQAVLDGADYIGVGPVFASSTKQFSSLAGLDLVRAAAEEIALPSFAIGGITIENVSDVLAAGATRVAASGAICAASDPCTATRDLLKMLDARGR